MELLSFIATITIGGIVARYISKQISDDALSQIKSKISKVEVEQTIQEMRIAVLANHLEALDKAFSTAGPRSPSPEGEAAPSPGKPLAQAPPTPRPISGVPKEPVASATPPPPRSGWSFGEQLKTNAEKPVEPEPPLPGAYTEKASRFEMEVGGRYLSIGGIVFLLIGIILLLNYTLAGGATTGLLIIAFGLALGILLVRLGDSFYHKGLQAFAHPLIAGGYCILFLDVCAAHFLFHLINEAVLFVFLLLLTALSGFSIFKYDSKLIGNFLLAVTFFAPFFIRFSLSQLPILFVYLIAVNLGALLVAAWKKWDYYLTASFLLTYFLYFHHHNPDDILSTMSFLTVFYLFFLISNHLVHFRGKEPSDYNLFVSYFNPIVFAVLSYGTLQRAPISQVVWLYLVLYFLLGIVHLLMATLAAKHERGDPRFADITQNNLFLSLLFITADVSFIPFLSAGTAHIPLATLLWFMEAFALLEISRRTVRQKPLLCRFSYVSLLLVLWQLSYVIPTIPANALLGRVHLTLLSAVLFHLYFNVLIRHPHAVETEDRFMAGTALLTGLWLGFLPFSATMRPALLMCTAAVAACLIMALALRHFERIGTLRYVSYVLAICIGLWGAVFSNQEVTRLILNDRFIALVATAAVLGVMFHLLRRHEAKLSPQETDYGVMLWSVIALLLMKGSFLESSGPVTTLAWGGIGLAALLISISKLRNERLATVPYLVLFATFLKSIHDSTTVGMEWGILEHSLELVSVGGSCLVFAAASRIAGVKPAARDGYYLYVLLTLLFYLSSILFSLYGALLAFQLILTVFWAVSSFLCITLGFLHQRKIVRFFGLVFLIASALKICAVDYWVLRYDSITLFLSMGGLLVVTSYLYQKNRDRIAEEPAGVFA